jgi:polyisoprenoid-binding protein YceI
MAITTAKDFGIETGKWDIDPAHSSVEFVVRHMMVAKVRGHFEKFEGSAEILEDLTQSTVSATIYADSITTRDQARDNHLKSADFLETEKYRTLNFSSTAVKPKDDGWILEGTLTLHGVSRPVALNVDFNGTTVDPYGKARAGFSATGELSRKDFGLEWNAALESGGVVVSDKVTINLEIELVKA